MASSASQITAGDLDGDETDDLVGLWPNSELKQKSESTIQKEIDFHKFINSFSG